MIRHGHAPFLECSSRGDKRFSALYARVKTFGNRRIEDVYQNSKIILIDGVPRTGLSFKEAKGKRPENLPEMRELYGSLWYWYIAENPHLLPILQSASGLSDMFGQPGSVCQATELWAIRCASLGVNPNGNVRQG